MTSRIVLLFVCLLITSSGCSSAQHSDQSDQIQINKTTLLRHVEVLAADEMEGRGTGSPGAAMARDYIENEMTEMGLAACTSSLQQPFSYESRRGNGDGINLVGRIEGSSESPKVLVVTAHYDHLGIRNDQIYNGADDNASGTAVLLEVARYLVQNQPVHTVIIASLDAEEVGLRGARALLESSCLEGIDVAMNINMDMVSRSPAAELYAVGTSHYPFLAPILNSLTLPPELELKFGHDIPGTGSDDWTSASDHGPFHSQGIPFVYFGVEDHPGYHNPSDDYDKITPDFFHAAASLITQAVLRFDASLDLAEF